MDDATMPEESSARLQLTDHRVDFEPRDVSLPQLHLAVDGCTTQMEGQQRQEQTEQQRCDEYLLRSGVAERMSRAAAARTVIDRNGLLPRALQPLQHLPVRRRQGLRSVTDEALIVLGPWRHLLSRADVDEHRLRLVQ
jgi:hypothetical protein